MAAVLRLVTAWRGSTDSMRRGRDPGVSAASGSQVLQEYEVEACEHDDDADVHDQSCYEMLSEEQDV